MDGGGFWLLVFLIVIAFVIFRVRKGKKSDNGASE